MTSAQQELLTNLSASRTCVAATTVLRTVLDDEWFETVERLIKQDSPSHTIQADPSGFLYDFCHPLRGAEWFEADQGLDYRAALRKIDEAGRFAIAFAGLDPLKTILPTIDPKTGRV